MSESYVATTAYGDVTLVPTDAMHIFVASDYSNNSAPLRVRGHALKVAAHLYRRIDGKFYIGEEDADWPARYNSLWGHRVESYGNSLTENQRALLTAEIEAVVNRFVDKSPGAMRLAAEENRRGKLDTIDTKIADLQKEIAALEIEREQWEVNE